jgi:hypothetical protein
MSARERGAYVELLDKPHCVTGGLLAGMAGLYSGMRGGKGVAVLLAALGVAALPAASIERS